ncbi:MAG: hypothetical protein KGL55_13250, partial [Rhodospirillales bacterium]|nr:hypothetical protein [Rhodospirillales bacterium]
MVALRDELDIPMPAMTPGYRMARPAPRVDPNTRRLAIIAGGIGAALLVIMGGWTLIGGGRGGVPVVQAPSGPVRVKPADAGGMQVAGANESILSDRTAAGEAALAPPPETPALAALKAQEAANAKAAAAATLAAAPPPAAETPAQASGQTGVQTDSRTAAASPPAAAAPVPLSRMIGPKTAEHPAAPASSGGWVTERPAEPGHALARAEPAPAAQTRPAAAIPSAALPA